MKKPVVYGQTCCYVYLGMYSVKLRSSRQEVLCKKVFLEISQGSQENTCGRVSFLIKLQASGLQL